MTRRKQRYWVWLFTAGALLVIVVSLIEAILQGRVVRMILLGLALALVVVIAFRDLLRWRKRRTTRESVPPPADKAPGP